MSKGERPEVDMTPLIQLITTSIAPGTWRVTDSTGQDLSPAYGLGRASAGPAAAAVREAGSTSSSGLRARSSPSSSASA